jgi:predicted amidohydrolase
MTKVDALQGTNRFPDLLVASIQMRPEVGNKAGNLRRSIELITQAAARGASLVVLPELANTGYAFESREEAFQLAEPVDGGESVGQWLEAAQRLGIHLVAGMAERCGAKLFNSAVMLGPQGLLGTYRKLHLWGDERVFFEDGDAGLPVVHTPLGRIASLICYDGWFPEAYRLLAVQGADLVCMPTNWVPMPGQPAGRHAMATTLAMANAHANGIAIVCANRVGTERGQEFIGQSLIVGSDGWPLAGPASIHEEEILTARVNLRTARRARQLNAFNHVLRDRRSDVYDLVPATGLPSARH